MVVRDFAAEAASVAGEIKVRMERAIGAILNQDQRDGVHPLVMRMFNRKAC
jgi:hypothetical protein